MEYKLTLDKAIAFLRVYLTLACCWPLPANATKLQRLRRSALRYFCCANIMVFTVTTIWTIYKHMDDSLIVLKLGCQLSVAVQIPLQLISFALQDKRLQFIVSEMDNYCRKAQKYEQEIFQYYVDKCKFLYGSVICWFIMTGLNVIIGPLLLPQPFPLETEYPFNVQYQPLKTIIFAQHIIIICQSVSQVSANTFSALILWFTVARFDILSVQFRAIKNMKEMIKCARKHHILLRYAEEVTKSIRYVSLLCVTFSTGCVIFGFLTVMSRHPWSVKWIFLTIAFSGFVELYMYAWPADNIINMSSNIASAVYESLWYKKDPITQKLMLYVILRSQHPVTISVPIVLPNLSMSYYTSYISTIFSYMTVVRMIMEE